MKSRRPARRTAYTLVEVLVAMSIITLAIGAASRLSLGQALTEDINQKESFAVNYAENAARLWQLGFDDNSSPKIQDILLRSLNADGTAMTVTTNDSNPDTPAIEAPADVQVDDDGTTPDRFAVIVKRTNVRVTYKPAKYTTPTSSDSARTQINDAVFLDFPILRQIPPRR